MGNQNLASGSLNAAASRLYYSVVQAVKCHGIAKHGWQVDTSNSPIHGEAARLVGTGERGNVYRGHFLRLKSLREKADYLPEGVERWEIDGLLGNASEIRLHHLKKASGESK